MATTTPNYGWAVPTSTDLVKDGATAIETLGDAIDASMNTALGTKKAGMVLLNTTSFSGVTSSSFPTGTFSSTYDNYRIIIKPLASGATNTNIRLRMRASGSDYTTGTYAQAFVFGGISSAVSRSFAASQTLWNMGDVVGDKLPMIFDLIDPFVATRTFAMGSDFSNQYFDQQSYILAIGADNSFDSLSVIASANTISGTMSVYGYNK
jgi:hypothetical protein